MPIQATIVLDSGSFLPMTNRSCQVGYFQCEESVSDIKIFADGEELTDLPKPFKLCELKDTKCKIQVVHIDKDNHAKTGGITVSKTFHPQLLHFEHLYGHGNHQPVEETKFDCVIRFDTGHFCASMVKKRDFKHHKKQPDGSYKHDPKDKPTTVEPIAHNMVVHFTLDDNEALELVRDTSTIWTSKNYSLRQRLEIEIVADNSTAEKFYRHALRDDKKSGYWLPNQGDPPPVCPMPPCPGFP